MKKIYKNKKTFLKYLAHSLLMVILPTMIFSVVILHFDRNILNKEIANTAEAKGKLIQTSADSCIKAIINNSIAVLDNYTICMKEQQNQVLTDIDIQREMNNDSSYDHAVHHQFLYSEQNNKLYNINKVINLDGKTEYLRVNGIGTGELVNSLKNYANISFIDECELEMNGEKRRCFIIAVFDGAVKKDRFVINFVDIEELFKEVNSDRVFLFDEADHLVAANFRGGYEQYTDYEFPEYDGEARLLDNSECYTFSIKSNIPGISYRIYTDYRMTFGAVRNVNNIFVFGLLVIMVIAIMVVPYLTKLQYRPIEDILNYLKDENISGELEHESEFIRIKCAIKNINSANKDLSATVNENKTAVKEFILLKLIYGEFASVQEFNSYAEKYKMSFKTDSICLVGFAGSFNIPMLREQVEKLERNGYFSTLLDENMIVYFMEEVPLRENGIKEMGQKIAENTGCRVYISVSSYSEDISRLLNTFIEIKNACEYSRFSQNDDIVYVEKQADANMLANYSMDNLDILIDSIEKLDEERINRNLEIMKNNMKRYVGSETTVRCMMYEIVIRILKEKRRLVNSQPDLEADANLYNNILSSPSIDDFFDAVKVVCSSMVSSLAVNNVHSNNLIDLITMKIESDFCKPEYSLNYLAEHFNMTPVNLSRYFKRKKGINIKDYTAGLEVSRAKELLVNSDLSVSEIAVAVGHMDTSNFIRKFKKYTGFTPGDFREFYKGENQ